MSDFPVDRALKWLLEEVICSRGVMRLFDDWDSEMTVICASETSSSAWTNIFREGYT